MRPAADTWPRRLRQATPVSAWALWQLPGWLRAYVVVVTASWLVLTAALASATRFRLADAGLLGLLLLCGAGTVELTRRAGETNGLVKDYFSVWHLPVAVLLPPCCACLAPAVLTSLTQFRVRRAPAHRRVFSAAALGLAYGGASVTSHAFAGRLPVGGAHAGAWLLVVIACGVQRWVVNHALIIPAVASAGHAVRLRDMLADADLARNDVAELCIAVLVTCAGAVSPLSVLLSIPFVTPLQRSLQHAQLLKDARTDAKTGLLNDAAWRREAAAELARAARTGTAPAVAMLDIDHFKTVNDTYGHLAGDRALHAIAAVLTGALRRYDRAGRFGGEEFAVLLPGTGADEARQIAERLRENIAATAITVDGGPALHVTVSIGVAVPRSPGCGLTELIATADAAMYEAKRAGRNRVHVAWTRIPVPAAAGPPGDGPSGEAGRVPVTAPGGGW
jgi:diguanylate cyclase (GGDEF)-like protein